jgi:hypothetical protein
MCDLLTEEQLIAELVDAPRGVVNDALTHLREGTSFNVSEWIELADGRRITLHNERGFSGQVFSYGVTGLPLQIDQWEHLTLEHLEASVLTTVLPDDAEVTGADHPWEWLAELAQRNGVEVTAADLRSVPYVVEFSDAVRDRLPQR